MIEHEGYEDPELRRLNEGEFWDYISEAFFDEAMNESSPYGSFGSGVLLLNIGDEYTPAARYLLQNLPMGNPDAAERDATIQMFGEPPPNDPGE